MVENRDYQGLTVYEGFVNRAEFGFRSLGTERGAGCIYGIDRMHKECHEGNFAEAEEEVIHRHISGCLLCEGAWNARLSDLMDSMTIERLEDEDPDD